MLSFLRFLFIHSDRLLQFLGSWHRIFAADLGPHFGRRCGLFRCRARRSIRLLCGNGSLWHVTNRHEAYRPNTEHYRRAYRHRSLLSRRVFFVAHFLALRCSFGAGIIPRWQSDELL